MGGDVVRASTKAQRYTRGIGGGRWKRFMRETPRGSPRQHRVKDNRAGRRGQGFSRVFARGVPGFDGQRGRPLVDKPPVAPEIVRARVAPVSEKIAVGGA